MNPTKSTIDRLIRLAREGDRDALGELLDTHRAYLEVISKRLLDRRLEARLDEAICLKMMSKQITDRHASMKDVAADLAAYLKETGKKPTTGSTISPRDDDQALAVMFAAQQSMPRVSVSKERNTSAAANTSSKRK